MKRTITSIFAFLLALAMVMPLAACGGESGSSTANPESIVKQKAEIALSAEILTSYEIKGAPSYDSYVTKKDENQYEVTGKATVKDKYGDSYVGKYTVMVKYNPETQEAEAGKVNLETPSKN